MREHRLIERMIDDLSWRLRGLEEDQRVDTDYIDLATDFIRTYADRCHHGKEEDILFRDLANKDLDELTSAMMTELIDDHRIARATTRRLVEANERYAKGDETALAEIDEAVGFLVGFYPVHIEKEDRHFFRPCLEYLSPEEQERMLEEFGVFDRQFDQELYRHRVEELERERGLSPSAGDRS
jgi:hemerythrin-like domain-containing protein